MKKVQLSTSYIVYDSVEELSANEKDLMAKAIEARSKAYAPYSKFKVGAALLLENGEIVTGNNQENAAYPSGMCAERVAIWKASSDFPNVKVLKIAITVKSENNHVATPVAPCGACRQTLSEYEINQKENIELYLMGQKGPVIKTASLLDLLPLAFDKSFLG